MSGLAVPSGAPGSVHHVLLLGPDDDVRRALHLMLDRAGKQVSAVAELDGARGFLADSQCDAVIAASELAAELARDGGAPPVIAVVRPRDPAFALALLEAGIADVVCDPL